MAELNFVKGTIQGRVGQFVGSSWRGKHYIKTYTPPTDPRKPSQIAVRNVFQHVAHIAKGIYSGILKPYTFPTPQKMTSFNKMVRTNKPLFDHHAWDPTRLRIFEGPLPGARELEPWFNPGDPAHGEYTGVCGVEFHSPGGELTDIAALVVYDEASGAVMYTVGTRAEGTLEVSFYTPSFEATGYNDFHGYLVFARPPAPDTNDLGLVSDTFYMKFTPPPAAAAPAGSDQETSAAPASPPA